jgi:peptidylprolyl isomerase
MKIAILPLSLLAVAMPLSAQTATAHTTHTASTHTATSTAAHHTAAVGDACLNLGPTSPKIPALAATAGCVKPLYTIIHMPQIKAEYISPLVSPALRQALDEKPERFSLGYVDVVKGTGALALPGKWISVKYTGWLPDGTKFDSSDDHPGKDPIDFVYGSHRVIQGWDTGFEGMHVGGKRRLFIPYQLAYGEAGKGPIPAKAALIFDIELTEVGDAAPKRTPPTPPAVKQTNPPATAVPPPSAANAKPAEPAKEEPKK